MVSLCARLVFSFFFFFLFFLFFLPISPKLFHTRRVQGWAVVSTIRRHARTFLLVNLHLGVHVDGEDDDVADNVESAHAHEDLRVFKGNFLRRLHHHEDDDEVGAVVSISVQCSMTGFREAQRVSRAAAAGVGDGHLRVHGGGGIELSSAACEEVGGGSGGEVR